MDHPFLTDGCILFDLISNHFFYIFQGHRICKSQNISYIQKGFISLFQSTVADLMLVNDLPVTNNFGNQCMTVNDRYFRTVSRAEHFRHNIKILNAFLKGTAAESVLYQFFGPLHILRGYALQNFQFPGSISAHYAKSSRHIDSTQAVGIGHRNSHYILNDISAAAHFHGLRHLSKHFPCLGCCVSNSNGFCTPQRRNQFIL